MRKILWVMVAIAAVCCAPVAAQHAAFKLNGAEVVAGQKVMGVLDVPAGVDAATQIPIVVVRGAHDGPTLAIVSGAHGTEYASIIAVEKLIGELNPAEISGAVVLVPLVNHASFQQKVPHVNPVDGKSMNRFYPGKTDGTQTERASYVMTHQVVDQADYLIDLHGGDLDENLRPYSYWTPVGNEKVDAEARDLVMAFGLNSIIIEKDFPRDANASRYLSNTAMTRGKPAVTAEAGFAGTTETDDIAALERGCLNVMRRLRMIAGDAPAVEHPVWIEKILTVTSASEGIFYPAVPRGSYVSEGMVIGRVTNYTNKEIETLRAPAAGVVLYICAVPSMAAGGTVANIGIVAAKAP